MLDGSIENTYGTGAMATSHNGAVVLEAVSQSEPTNQPQVTPRQRRTFFRVSVRALLLLILLIGCGLGWLARVMRTGQVQRRAVAAIYQAGGWVVYDTDWDERQGTTKWMPLFM